ncbi:MAG: hypothetical protein ABTQ32_03260 [Myxococcaceae bacterium]
MNELTVKILGQIRDELKATRSDLTSRLDQTNERLDQTNERLDQTNERLERLERRQVETEVRLSTELATVAAAITDLSKVLVDDRKLRTQVADHEARLKALEKKRAS